MRRPIKSKLRGRKKSSFLGYVQTLLARPVLLYGTLTVVLLLLSLSHIQMATTLRLTLWSVFSPVFTTITKPFVAVTSIASDISGFQQLKADNKQLKKENEDLTDWYHTAQLLKAENASLKSLLNVKSTSDPIFMTAKILADPSSPYVQSVLLDIGEQDGVETGQAAISQTGLLGRVVDVQSSISRILLLTDINSRVPVVIEGTSQKAVLAGHNLKELTLEYIPDTVSLEKGMRVVTSGDGGVFPLGLPVGTIKSVMPDEILVSLSSKSIDIKFVKLLKRRKD
jgi:rod shape-determining protein MreC